MIGLLRSLDEFEGDVEADLQAHYGVDYRDRFRTDPESGRPVLTLRRLAVLMARIPADRSAFVAAVTGTRPWSREAEMLDEVRRTTLAVHGVKNPKPHPDRDGRRRNNVVEMDRRRKVAAERAKRRRAQLGG